ncbi:MAG: KTSC domain-containing protein [Bacteroidetes bacterium]|nr:MAG: KTSC domain-containing protein [Bacteroidota bacterium]
MKRIAVESSMVNAVGYDQKSKTLYLEFTNTGYVYQYLEVGQDIFEELLNADSLGSYIRNNIFEEYAGKKVKRRNFRW